MFKKIIINVSSNLKRGLHLGTKIKSNGCLDIGTEGVKNMCLDRTIMQTNYRCLKKLFLLTITFVQLKSRIYHLSQESNYFLETFNKWIYSKI